ncbi:uncharacterized protein M421DRAFT_402062 [Didymella exigua CBS 183.55]|uniref:Uncharacterized protein n=1 Tax=Didymella exigua CBS 183.55 TaxID=1150837 RepID=A0A6A5R8T0_9PLEO|nr:uncharacterized protein M421DRAFT_402062 [Didymella exigua CBS 183.55]KAF1924625.1 hypothetical protein M421DRAFT_402062 [Didymella exigua CBS 183.55]
MQVHMPSSRNNLKWKHRGRQIPVPHLPQEVWDNITTWLLPSSALIAAKIFNFESNAYDQVWTAVFKNERWLESHCAQDAKMVLIGTDLDILSGPTTDKAQPRLVLATFDGCGELQYKDDLLSASLRGGIPSSEGYQLEQLTLAVSRLDVPEVLGQDFCYLFSSREEDIQTRYCYWKDPEKRIRTLCSQDIRGIDGPITQLQNLRPVFLLNLDPPTKIMSDSSEPSSSDPVQFIFRCFGGSSFWAGDPPLVDVIRSEGWELSQRECTFQGFTFRVGKYREYDRQYTDWTSVAEMESGQKCTAITTW